MSKVILALRSLSSVVLFSGSGFIAMGLGLIPVPEDLWNVTVAVVGSGISSSLKQPFCILLGTTKVLGVLSLWKIIPKVPRPLTYAALTVPPACGLYGHAKLGETTEACIAGTYLSIVLALYALEGKEEMKSESDKKE